MPTITVITKSSQNQIETYLSFSAKIVDEGVDKFGSHVFAVYAEQRDMDYTIGRLNSGLHGAREQNEEDLYGPYLFWLSRWRTYKTAKAENGFIEIQSVDVVQDNGWKMLINGEHNVVDLERPTF